MSVKKDKIIRTVLWVTVFVLIVTMFVASYFRIEHIRYSVESKTMPAESLIDYGYARYPLLSIIHILPGLVFLVLGALQFAKPVRNKYIRLHRFCGKLYLLLGAVIGITSIFMAFMIRFGGWIETAAVLVFGSWFLYALGRAYLHIRKKEIAAHRRWMIRAYSIGIAVASMRPIIGLLLAFTQIPFADFFGTVFWIAFVLHALVAERWIKYTAQTATVSRV